jgi:diguanylate cyclase (GGDEF)-like protein
LITGNSISFVLQIGEIVGYSGKARVAGKFGGEVRFACMVNYKTHHWHESDLAATILIVEDDPSLALMVTDVLSTEGYTVLSAHNGEHALEIARLTPPDLLLLDLLLPGELGGFDVLLHFRSEPKLMHVPVIMITGRNEVSYRVRAYDLHVNTYLLKPFNNDELLAIVKNQLYLSRGSLLSPLTRLPAGDQVELATLRVLDAGQPWAMMYLDLDNFKALNDGYGFKSGNDMIRLLGETIATATRELGNPTDFVGHIGGEDFLVITTPERTHRLCSTIIERFTAASRRFYTPEDLERGAFMAVGRSSGTQLFPLISVSIAVLLSDRFEWRPTFDEVSRRQAWLKARSKKTPGNCFVIDGEEPVLCPVGLLT